jgi:4-hydroxybenzoate polyprenyltransferase
MLGKFLRLIRLKQWYKNLVIFLPIIFAGLIFNLPSLIKVFLAFISFSLASSFNYIINDIIDRKKDRNNPEKKIRPIADNKVGIWEALITAFMVLFVSLIIGIYLGMNYLLTLAGFVILTQLYTFYLKKEIFADIIIIAINFVLRAVAGAFILNLRISPWLILCPFFLSLYISVGKRESEINYLGSKARLQRPVLSKYTPMLTNALMVSTTTSLIICYALYSFLSIYSNLLLTLPFAIYVIFRYLQIIYSGSEIARHPENVFKDIRTDIGIFLWIASVVIIIYFL